MNQAFADRMKAAQETDAFKQAKEAAKKSFISDVPDGTYVVVPAKAAFQDLPGKEMVKWAWLIVEGEHANKTLYDNSRFETDENITYFLKRLYTLGIDIDTFDISEDLKDTLAYIVQEKARIEVTVKTKGEFQNVYVNKLLDGYEEPEAVETVMPTPETAPAAEPPKRGRKTRTAVAAPEPEPEPEVEAEAEEEEEVEAETEEEQEEGEVEVIPGTTVRFSFKGTELVGVIKEVIGDEPETAEFVIKPNDGSAPKRVKADRLIEVIP